MYIKNILVKNNLIFAPMAGITDSPTRIITKRLGAGMVYSEMVSCEGLIRFHKKTEELLLIDDFERPIAVQIFGQNAKNMAEAAFIVADKGADAIDINFGCPAKKVIKAKSGSYLMQYPPKIAEIIKEVRSKINIPLTVKIRAGWNKQTINALEIAKIAEEEGADAITVHPRTQSEMFTGKSNWEIIAQVKKHIKIPVIGNGDILTPEDAKRMFLETECDAVMIGRGALGNPWIFEATEHFLKTGEKLPEPSFQTRIKTAIQHFEYEVEYKGESRGVKESFKIIFWYLKGCPNVHLVRQEIIKHKKAEEIKQILNNYLQSIGL